MNEKVLRTLEYYKIIDQLVQKADSEPEGMSRFVSVLDHKHVKTGNERQYQYEFGDIMKDGHTVEGEVADNGYHLQKSNDESRFPGEIVREDAVTKKSDGSRVKRNCHTL